MYKYVCINNNFKWKERWKDGEVEKESHSMVISFVWACYLSEYNTTRSHTAREGEAAEEKHTTLLRDGIFGIYSDCITNTHTHTHTSTTGSTRNRKKEGKEMSGEHMNGSSGKWRTDRWWLPIQKSVRTRKVQTRIIIIGIVFILLYDVKRCAVQYLTTTTIDTNKNLSASCCIKWSL